MTLAGILPNMKISAVLILALLVVPACSKKAKEPETVAEQAPATPVEPAAAPAAGDGAFDPNVAATVAPTTAARGAKAQGAGGKNWDAVVGEIVQLRSIQRSSTQTERMNALEDELMAAIETDPAAKEARQNLARIINKR